MSTTRLSKEEQAQLVLSTPSSSRIDISTFISAAPASDDDIALLTYRVPFVTEDGTCSMPDKLQAEPHSTMAALSAATLLDGRPALCHVVEGGDARAVEAVRVRSLRALCRALAEGTGSQWVGVYERMRLAGDRHDTLVKLQYIGAPSRPYFPLTPAFASHSNNSTVGLSGAAVLIADTRAMEADTPYYTCDGRVRAELCAPITNAAGQVVGIIDAEAFKPHTYTPAAVALILDVCAQLGASDLMRTLLPLPSRAEGSP